MAAPVNAAIMWSVPQELRPFALSAAEAAQHLLGDIPAPPTLGWLQVGGWGGGGGRGAAQACRRLRRRSAAAESNSERAPCSARAVWGPKP
jgi:hypothetical protein